MLKKYPIIKWSLLSLGTLLLLLVAFGYWFFSLLPEKDTSKDITESRIENLSYLSQNKMPYRGKILAVVTSTATMGKSGKSTGYELTELSRAYYVFSANGFEVDIASPAGGEPPVVIDGDDMGVFDYAFLNDPVAQHKARHTLSMDQVQTDDYVAVFFAGGKGAMFDFPDNPYIQSMLKKYHQSNKVIGAVCHGPAALAHVQLDDGQSLLNGTSVCSFTNEEELLLIPDAAEIFPFLLQDELSAQGAVFQAGNMYLENVIQDENIITGQNPWSTWKMAETMIQQLGYTPKYRVLTGEENAVNVLKIYDEMGAKKAREWVDHLIKEEHQPVDRVLIASHSIIAVLKGDIGRFFGLIRLTSYLKKVSASA